MPKEWYDRHAALAIDDPDIRSQYISILADKKPYFMRYIYEDLMRQYNTYVRNTEKKAQREFAMSVDELLAKPEEELTEKEHEFVFYYQKGMPVGTGDCTMNRICRRIESEFDGYISKRSKSLEFDYRILKCEAEYSTTRYNAVRRLYSDYNSRLWDYTIYAKRERIDDDEASTHVLQMRDEFQRDCYSICPDSNELCNIVVDMCYKSNNTKSFAWNMCASDIISNLTKNGDGCIRYPVRDADGDIEFGGERFSLHIKKIGEQDGNYSE